ncbi:uncharacterized protein LOC109862420 isoform X2 [Pseudomyrmex gracilis]|nr:uncharacterized protein LOC109862420 isoform X2 [Pseudomyrmex gracilis]XP_020298291.1 uncharacterized protein LOC109862420 isoform X2 [Pseudomyrmex gracilis]XP_020298352.1 uncharacterized protein LOC109862420 isoform X2 [Pseudomyrmex gracilis]XP_020298405.1 uncharacterized protein LOC109862420 isoform X2 [Pseudomyrmex gracilis]XP_020298460.1 uncharacterized protein LOC109862420 isoform X2 [Pseudomyrmex gracilis]XP_020298512.1 uncharacterized protein LOC109862420 isoform X2 [Pseudomyrmex gra
MKLLIVCALIAVAAAAPGLLRVPRVYNAVITSNQNLSPSRAIPVIQPIIHRTAYAPGIYYTQITPHSVVSEVVHYPPLSGGEVLRNDQTQASSSRLVESTSFGIAKERATTERNKNDESKSDNTTNNSPKKPEPLSFYPNYRSRYYVPYVYTYNSFNPHYVPGTYYVDYKLFSTVEPIPATNPKKKTSILLPSFHDEERMKKNNNKQTVPDVPPPPLPTSVPKKS